MSNFSDEPFSLDKLRSTLVRLEDTIIFGKYPENCCNIRENQHGWHYARRTALIERAQFAFNRSIYTPGALEFKGATGERSFLEYFLWETEKVHGKLKKTLSARCCQHPNLRYVPDLKSQGPKVHEVKSLA